MWRRGPWEEYRLPSVAPYPLPFLGQVECAINEGTPLLGSVGQEHTNLAVLTAPSGAAILARHAGGLGTFLDKTRFVDNQHGVGITQIVHDIGPEIITHRIGIPACSVQQALHALRSVFLQLFRQLPPTLALDRTEEAHQIVTGARPHLRPAKAGRDARVHRVKSYYPISMHMSASRGNGSKCHNALAAQAQG